jgi:2-methylcitrate dehydratase PrpD
MRERPLVPAEIDHIDIHLSHAAFHHGWWELERPLTPIAAQMNVAYATAVAILDGAAMVQQFAPGRIDRDDVWQLIPRIKAHHDPKFDLSGSAARHARVTVRLKDGSILQHFVQSARTIASPLSNREIEAKYRTLTEDIIDKDRRAEIAECILGLEKAASTADLSRLLGPEVGSPF